MSASKLATFDARLAQAAAERGLRWRPGTPHPLPPNMSTIEAATLLPRVLAAAAAPPALLGTDVG